MASPRSKPTTSTALASALLASAALAVGCGDSGAPDVAAAGPLQVSGYYVVEGTTTVLATGETRTIQGIVILSQEEASYVATFSLETAFPSKEGAIEVEVVGRGEGAVSGNQLLGTAATQIIMAPFAGVDTRFPFLPNRFGPRIESKSTATVSPDGSIDLEIESAAAEGQQYAATRTAMKGRRARRRGAEGFPEPGRVLTD